LGKGKRINRALESLKGHVEKKKKNHFLTGSSKRERICMARPQARQKPEKRDPYD